MSDQHINRENDTQPPLPHDAPRTGWLPVLSGVFALILGAVIGGFMGGVLYQITRGGGGGYYGEIGIAFEMVLMGAMTGAIGGAIGGFILGSRLDKNQKTT